MKVIAVILLLSALSLRAATNTCATCEVWEVGPALTNAASGDVIIMPAGTCEWTNSVWIRKAVLFYGQGTNDTIIVDQLPSRSNPLITVVQTNYTVLMRITGIQFKNGTNQSSHAAGMIVMQNSGDLSNAPPWRIDHCFFNAQKGRPIYVYGYTGGLIDRNVFKQDGAAGFAFDGRMPSSANKGHLSWSVGVQMGTTNEGMYVEANYFTNSSLRAITDQFAGARTVFRYNTCYGVAMENHGTESTGEYRGGRWLTGYGNTFTWNGSLGEASSLWRSGTGVFFNNTNSGNWPAIARFFNHRNESTYAPWRGATGTNAWDTNFNNGEVLVSGTHTGTNGSPKYLVDSTKSWTVNALAGYTVVVEGSTNFGYISANTATAATMYNSTFANNNIFFTNGNAYEMRLVVRALDQPGSGPGDLLTGGSAATWTQPTNTVTLYPSADNLTNGYPNTIEPIYIWDNYGDAVNVATIPIIQENRDYILSAHPTYVPLVYPHPLAGGGSVPASGNTITVNGDVRANRLTIRGSQ